MYHISPHVIVDIVIVVDDIIIIIIIIDHRSSIIDHRSSYMIENHIVETIYCTASYNSLYHFTPNAWCCAVNH